jgi:hypothetical protein
VGKRGKKRSTLDGVFPKSRSLRQAQGRLFGFAQDDTSWRFAITNEAVMLSPERQPKESISPQASAEFFNSHLMSNV